MANKKLCKILALTFTLMISLNPKLSLAEKRIGVEAAALVGDRSSRDSQLPWFFFRM